MTEGDLRARLVDAFPLSKRRARLWSNLEWFISELRRLRIPATIWLDGSYLTEKIDPDDIDLIVQVDFDFANSTSPEQDAFLADVVDQTWHDEPRKLHTFVMLSAPVGHPYHPTWVADQHGWVQDFGYSLVKRTPKGIVLLEVVP